MNMTRHWAQLNRAVRPLLAGLLLTAPLAVRAEYPEQPIRVFVAFPAGSAVDVVARSILSRLAGPLGQPVVIENKVGASGNIGFELAARAPKDGYTLLFAPTQLAANPGLGKVNYDPIKDFAPIMLTSRISALLVVPPDSPARTVAELIAMAKAKPGTLSYASGGNGGIGHFSGELLKSNGGNLDIVHIPYKSAAEQVQSVMANQTAFAYPAMQLALQQVRGRQAACACRHRRQTQPVVARRADHVRSDESRFRARCLVRPARARRNAARDRRTSSTRNSAKVLRDPAVRASLVDGSHEIVASTPAEFAATIQQRSSRSGAIWPAS